jgi:putative redox protein
MDTSEAGGGANGAASPKELLLLALGGCTSMDVIGILQKKRAPMKGYETYLTAEVAEEHPQVFTSVHIEYVVHGIDVKPDDVQRAIDLSETKYCSVSAMLRPAMVITSSFTIVE